MLDEGDWQPEFKSLVPVSNCAGYSTQLQGTLKLDCHPMPIKKKLTLKKKATIGRKAIQREFITALKLVAHLYQCLINHEKKSK